LDIYASILASLPADLRESVQANLPLRELTTLRVGGPARIVCRLGNPDQARRFQAIGAEHAASTFILGGGSNVLGADEGFAGMVLRVETRNFTVSGDIVTVGAGLDFDGLIQHSLEAGLTGLEFASGIPGTVGGALVGNAGCYGHEIGEFLEEALVLRPDGRLETVGPEAFGFRYRTTELRETGDILLEARLRLARGDLHAAGAEREDHLADRRRKHPVAEPSAGSWFRNLPPAEAGGRRRAAGVLLEEAGAKEMREGDAAVYAKHANIIVNRGAARGQDCRRLADRMAAAVREKFGVELVEEVRSLGPIGPGT